MQPPVSLTIPEGFTKGQPTAPGCYVILSRKTAGGFSLFVADIFTRLVGSCVRLTGVRTSGGRNRVFGITSSVLAYKLIGPALLDDVAKATEFFDDL